MRTLYSFILLLVLIADPAFAEQTMTLEQCLKTGLANNPSLKASRLTVESSSTEIKMARADFLPSISSSYSAKSIFDNSNTGLINQSYLDQDAHTFSVKLSQILYAGSRIVNTYQKDKFLKQSSEAQLHLSALQLAYTIETTFFQLMKAREDIISATESVTRLTENVKFAEAFLQKELVAYVDVLKSRVDLADAENQLSLQKNNENRQREALFSLMNLPMDQDLKFIDGKYYIYKQTPTFEESFQHAIKNRPDLKSLEYQVLAAKKEGTIAAAQYLPVATFDIGYYSEDTNYTNLRQIGTNPEPEPEEFYDPDTNNKYGMASVTLTWNLFDGGKAYYGNKKASIEAQKFQALAVDARNTISTGIRKALYSMSEAEQRLTSSTDALAAANENYTSEVKRLAAGISTVQNLLDAQGRLVRSEANKTNAMLDYQLARSELVLMTGGEVWRKVVIDE